MSRDYPCLYLGGAWVAARSGATLTCLNPATGRPWATVPAAGVEDVDAAVSAAHVAARGPWSTVSPSHRGRLLSALAVAVRDNAERLAELESTDNGKPLRDTLGEVHKAADWLTFYAGAADKLNGEHIPFRPDAVAYTRREPVGVVAAITPWNSPLYLYAWKLGPALASGNTIVLKPAELTPVTALELGALVHQAGFPAGVVNIVPGTGSTAGAALVSHPLVDKVAFTGSTATATAIMAAASTTLKRATFECGGKNAHIVFADADLDRAVVVALHSAFRSTGQSCALGSRLFLHRTVHDEFLARLAGLTRAIRVGPPLDRTTHIGPHISREQLDKTLRYIAIAHDEGAELVVGGDRPADLDGGFYVNPTIFLTDDHRSRIAQEEIFGPVLTVLPFDTEDEVVAMANDTRYGLVAGLWTADVTRAHRVAHDIRAGLVSVNTFRPVHYMLPYGGYKQSGIGRENGLAALHEYTEIKTIVIDLASGPVDNPW